MPRIMYDSITASAIPRDAAMVAGYIDGDRYVWTQADWNRFPHAIKVRIARRVTTNDGHVLDVEAGIPTVWPPTNRIVQWVQMRRNSGVEPTIYCNQLNDWAGIRTLFRNAGVPEPQWWVARYNNFRDIPSGAVAKQFANPPLSGGHYDLSIVADHWPGVDNPQENIMAGEADFAFRYVAEQSHGDPDNSIPPPFGHGVHAGDWLQDMRLELREARQQLAELKALVAALLGEGVTLRASGAITVTPEPPDGS